MLKDRKFKKAWLILSRDRIVNIFSTRKNEDFIFEYIKDLYCYENFTLREKAVQSDYAHGTKYRKDFFEYGINLSTSYTSSVYRDMMFDLRDNGFDSPNSKELLEKWKKYPQYYKIGNPVVVEARKVYNLVISGENGKGILEWDEQNINGETAHKTHNEQTIKISDAVKYLK